MWTDQRTSDISIIIPTLNEETLLPATLAAARQGAREILVVDGGSRDRTVAVARRAGARVIEAGQASRGRRLNLGADRATGRFLLFLHADTLLPPRFDREVEALLAAPGVAAGAFRLAIASHRPGARLIEGLANRRSRLLQLPYGDQGLFLRRGRFLAAGGFAEMPFLEDLELVRRLRNQGRIVLSDQPVRTSARRWQRLGLWQTTLINQLILIGFFLGLSPHRLAAWYRHQGGNSRRAGQQLAGKTAVLDKGEKKPRA